MQQRPQPFNSTPLPILQRQKVGSDLFEWQQFNYLLVVDYYSRCIEIARLNRTTTAKVITHLKSIFARDGIPETLVSDNGPQYSSQEFSEFAREYEFRHITSSPYHLQGNGEAERAVGSVKDLLKKSNDPYRPLKVGYSPSQCLMSHTLRSLVPTTWVQRKPHVPDITSVKREHRRNKARQKEDFDSHHSARSLPLL